MKLLIFGATGTISRQVVPQALEQGHADVADFMLKQLADDFYLHQTPAVSD